MIWPGCQHSWRTGATISLQKYPHFLQGSSSKSATLQDWCDIHWVRHCPWQCWGSQEEVWRKALEFWGWEAKESEMYRLCLGFKTLQVHDIVADPIGKYDMILSRHTLQVIVFFVSYFCFVLCFWTLLLTMILQQHLKTGDVERVIANFAKSGSTFLLTTNFPTAKVRRQCVCDLNQTHKKTEIIPDIFALFHHIWYR